MTNYIVFQAYGRDYIFNECYYAILSILKQKPKENYTFLIYTDQPSKFDWLELHNSIVEPLSENTIHSYKGHINFVHRVKIKILEHALANYQGNFIYLDTDMYALTDVSELFNKINLTQTLMHEQEGSIKSKYNLVAKKIYKFVSSNTGWLEEKNINLNLNTIMFNAGVIGISNNHSFIVKKVLDDTDNIYPVFPSHIVEQISFSLELQNHSAVIDTTNHIFHYWFFKEYRSILSDYFSYHQTKGSTIQQIIENIDLINPQQLSLSKFEYNQSGFWLKFWKRLTIKKWKIPPYTFE